VVERKLSGDLLGLTLPPSLIVLRSGLSDPMRDLVLGHELGHVLVSRGLCPWVTPATEEAFCDSFAAAVTASADPDAVRKARRAGAPRLAG
jgi:hypothetical protein